MSPERVAASTVGVDAVGREAPPHGPPFALPEGARWSGDNRKAWEFPWRFWKRTPWWRYWGQTTVYAGRHHTSVVYCDTEATADAVIALHHPDAAASGSEEDG